MDICKPSYIKYYLRESTGKSTAEVQSILDSISITLRDRWIGSGYSDFSIYRDPLYIFDMAHCYIRFSRQAINKTFQILPDLSSIHDYYNGIGLTTIQAMGLWKNAKIFYFNDVESQTEWMFGFCKRFRKNSKKIVDDFSLEYDAVFLFEVLEHMKEPEIFFGEIIDPHIKKYLVYSAPFGEMWGGHFPEYHGVESKKYKRRFNNFLNGLGYRLIYSGFNGRPLIFEKRGRG